MGRLTKSDNLLLALLVCAIVLLTSIPYLAGYAVEDNQQAYMGIVSNVPDWVQYKSWMKGFENHVVIKNPMTSELQTPSFFNAQWLVLGKLRAWTGLPDWLVIQFFRIASTIAFLLFTFWMSRRYFGERRLVYWTSFLLITFGAGLGWLWVLEKQLSGELKFPLDVYVAEAVTFQNAIIYPHFLVGAGLILLSLVSYVYAVQTQRVAYALLAGASGLLLGLTHAYDLLIVYGVVALLAPLLVLRGSSISKVFIYSLILALISVPPAAYFAYLTSTDELWSRILEQFADAGVFTPSLPHLLILLGIPFMVALLGYDGFFPIRERTPMRLLVRAWFLVNIVLLYIPTDFQIHMLSGIQIPIGILAAEALFDRILPHARVRFLPPSMNGAEVPAPWYLRDATIAALLILLVLPTNLYLLAWRTKNVFTGHEQIYLHRNDIEAMRWLAENTSPDKIVFAPLDVGQYVPGIAGNHVFLGHWAQTVDFAEKQRLVAHFFDAATPNDQRQEILAVSGADLLFQPVTNRAEGMPDICEQLDLPIQFHIGEASICQVTTSSPEG